MLKIKDIKHGQIFYGINGLGEPYGFQAWGDAALINGVWTVEGECRANYCYTFTEDDEPTLFLTDDLE
jgi:hypothetical protein